MAGSDTDGDTTRSAEGVFWGKVGSVAGVIGVIVAIIFGVAQVSGPSQPPVLTPSATPPAPTTQTLPPPTTLLESTSDPVAAAKPVVRHEGSITLALRGERVDLDSPMDDPQWQTDIGEIDYGAVVGSKQRQFVVHTGTSVRLGSERADYETCRTKTGYSTDGYYLTGTLTEGEYLCVQTGEKRYSAIKLLDIQDQQITIYVVTYDPPND